MHIMTENGWKELVVKCDNKLEPNTDIYKGPIPSLECLSFIAKSEREHQEWADKRKQMTER